MINIRKQDLYIALLAFLLGGLSGWHIHRFYLQDKCLDRGGANDAIAGVCLMDRQ